MGVFYQHNGEGLQPVQRSMGLRLEAEELYRKVGGIQTIRVEHFIKARKSFGGRVGHIVLDEKSSLSLITDWDWEIAEFICSQE